MINILLFLFICLCLVFIFYYYCKKYSINKLKRELAKLESELKQQQQKMLEIAKQITEKNNEYNQKIIDLQNVENTINIKTESMKSISDSLAILRKNNDEEKQKINDEFKSKLQDIEKENAELLFVKNKEVQEKITQLEQQLEDERSKYLSAIETIVLASENNIDNKRHIQVDNSYREDIDFLLNNVVNKLSKPDVLYKLIWSEYIQKPTNEMLDYILPKKDCAGIYKITNDSNKKSYIGRSTSVRKRLTDHVKSSIGISTIADQKIHKIMREEGIWNFTFELVEECPKEQLGEREKYYINFFSTEKLGYNQKAGG